MAFPRNLRLGGLPDIKGIADRHADQPGSLPIPDVYQYIDIYFISICPRLLSSPIPLSWSLSHMQLRQKPGRECRSFPNCVPRGCPICLGHLVRQWFAEAFAHGGIPIGGKLALAVERNMWRWAGLVVAILVLLLGILFVRGKVPHKRSAKTFTSSIGV
jgi:hypothetical protein